MDVYRVTCYHGVARPKLANRGGGHRMHLAVNVEGVGGALDRYTVTNKSDSQVRFCFVSAIL
jgi:hypothetical protein